jgi:hypothetical protein
MMMCAASIARIRPVRRARRLTVRVLTTMLSILFLGALTLWIRSYWVMDSIYKSLRTDIRNRDYVWESLSLSSSRGRVRLVRESKHVVAWIDIYMDVSSPGIVRASTPITGAIGGDPPGGPRLLGFRLWDRTQIQQTFTIGERRVFQIPYWAIALATSPAPAAAVRRAWLRRRQTLRNLCVNCGYDLRATPGRCPECGGTRGGQTSGTN